MNDILQYDLPTWHPAAVHFPLALILTAACVAVVWAVRGTAFWRRATLLLLGVGMAGLAVAYFTGEAIVEYAEETAVVEELLGLHEALGLYALIATGVALAGVGLLSFWAERRTTLERDPPDPMVTRIVLAVLTVAAAVLVAGAGYVGIVMVWGE